MPRPFIYVAITIVVLAMIPPALIARARTRTSESQRIHIIQDMDNQARFRAQHPNALFRDGRAMRPPVEGTVARGELRENDHFERGIAQGRWATALPPEVPVTRTLVERGAERFKIYCSVCHGLDGYGTGIVNKRALELQNNPAIGNGTTWVQAKNLHEPLIRVQPPGEIFNTITNGKATMSGYAAQVPTADRWAIVAYVKALQRSQSAKKGDVPPGVYETLPLVNLIPPPEVE